MLLSYGNLKLFFIIMYNMKKVLDYHYGIYIISRVHNNYAKGEYITLSLSLYIYIYYSVPTLVPYNYCI